MYTSIKYDILKSMKKKILLLPLLSIALVGCSFEDLMFWKKKDNEQSEKEKEQEQEQTQDEPKNYKTLTIETFGDGLDEFLNDAGHVSDCLDEFTNYLKNQSTANLITSVAIENLHGREWDDNLYLQFGSGQQAIGSLDINFANKVYKVDAKVLCYSKTFIPGGQTEPITNVDSWSHFSINGKDNALSYDESRGIEVFTFSNDISTGTNTVTLASSMGRVLMKEFTIYYL